MTNTKFRKRMLLSSVAMLLVALVALGSATFAWFSTTNNATASKFEAKTNKSSNILLSETGDSGWVQNLTFTANTSYGAGGNGLIAMTPVTTNDFTNWYSVEADNYNEGFKQTGGTALNSIKTSGQYVKYTTLFVQNTGTTAAVNLTANIKVPNTGDPTTGSDYIRCALVPIDVAGSNATAKNNGNLVFGDGDDYSNTANGWTSATQAAPTSSDTIVTGAFGAAQSLGTLTKDAIYGWDVYVWYEGTDLQCKDQYAGTDLYIDFAIALA